MLSNFPWTYLQLTEYSANFPFYFNRNLYGIYESIKGWPEMRNISVTDTDNYVQIKELSSGNVVCTVSLYRPSVSKP